ncbi:hypothetical protein [Methanobrevibacter sp.]|uniref:hypothetical protein n=1 Tax=Methanobrevibacter sp. TaxID=66852 RepID=UPI00388F3B72
MTDKQDACAQLAQKHNEFIEKERERIMNQIREAIDNERTELGKSVLKQLLEVLE